jgi:hypothetical protein
VFGGDYFEDQPQKFALKECAITDGIDDVVDPEQSGQVACHASDFNPKRRKRCWVFHSNCSECGNGSHVSQAYLGSGSRFAFVHQKQEFGFSDADRITMFDGFAIYRNSIHKGAVAAGEIDDLILFAHLLDRAMFERDHDVDQAQLVRFVTTDRYLAINQGSNGSCQRTRDGEEPRLHQCLRCVKV